MNEPIALANLIIIALTAVISYRGFRDSRFLEKCLFAPGAILERGEYYRILSSAFIHGDVMHLAFNMFSLYSFGKYVELIFGLRAFLAIYLAGILGGNLLSLAIHRKGDYRALGASGGVCGIIYASIFLLPGGAVYIFPLPIPIPSAMFAVLFIAASFYGFRNRIGNIGHDAHLGGAVIGLVAATLLFPTIISSNPVLYPAVMGIAVLLFIASLSFGRRR